ncbi:MAG: hypothetical protein M3Q36_03010 [bacterium]|nr:hypothetical protein [bacterium]
MQTESLPLSAKRLEKYILTLPSAKQFNTLSTEPRKAMMQLTATAYSLRIACDRYFHADDSSEQQIFLEEAKQSAKLLNDYILYASQFDLVSAVDVAHLSALAVHIHERLG